MGDWLAVFLLMACMQSGVAITTGKRPNIVLIVADDLGWDDISFHGSKQIPTPAIDELAHSGVMLNNYYVQPICTPTRSCFMTGRHPIHTGMQSGVIMGQDPYGLGLDEKLLPEYLKELGYSTHGIGKWHLGFFEVEYTPTYRGFDSFFGYWTGKEDYYTHIDNEGSGYIGYDYRDNLSIADNYRGQYNTELFTQRAINVIENQDPSQPFFLYLAHEAVHSANPSDPLQAPQYLIDKFGYIENKQRQIFAAMVTSLDQSVRNVTDALKTNGLWNNSVIVFTTDNGGPAYFDANIACNMPLRGRKAQLWEGGVRGTACVYSPLIENKQQVSMEMMHATDWLPTFVHLAGGNASDMKPKDKTLDGYNIWETISTGAQSPRTEVLHNILGKSAALRVGDYKLLVNVENSTWYPLPTVSDAVSGWDRAYGNGVVYCGSRPVNATDCDSHKSPCLYNINSDPCEYNNLAPMMQFKVDELMKRLQDYNATYVPPRNKPADPQSNPSLHGGVWSPWRNFTDTI
jgi:arylsulfatase A-like enzyme